MSFRPKPISRLLPPVSQEPLVNTIIHLIPGVTLGLNLQLPLTIHYCFESLLTAWVVVYTYAEILLSLPSFLRLAFPDYL